jgi:hypothetical protein
MVREKSGDTLRYREDMLSLVRNVGEILMWVPDAQVEAAEVCLLFSLSLSVHGSVVYFELCLCKHGGF